MQNNNVGKRKRISEEVMGQVLIQSKRRCCLCFHLNNDQREKRGQIAHIDRKRNNNQEENLAYLCMDHHDQYDSITSQSKGILPVELKHAKKSLLNAISELEHGTKIQIEIKISGNYEELTNSQKEELLHKALQEISLTEKPKIMTMEPGSIKYKVEASYEDALRILKAFNSNKLKDSSVQSIKYLNLSESLESKPTYFAKGFDIFDFVLDEEQVWSAARDPDKKSILTESDDEKILLHLKKISYKETIIVGFSESKDKKQIEFAFPFLHDDLRITKENGPLEVFDKFLSAFGNQIKLNHKIATLWIDEIVDTPIMVSKIATSIFELRDYFEFLIYGNDHNPGTYFCRVCNNIVATHNVNVALFFGISIQKYSRHLKKLKKKKVRIQSLLSFSTRHDFFS